MARSRWISDLHWARTGQQSRSQKTQESLLDAAEGLFAEKGAEGMSVADVATRAGCSVGSMYHHFRDKKALLYALFDRTSEQFRATTREAVDPARWDGASIADILRGYLEFSLEVGRERPGFQRAELEASLNDPTLRAHLVEVRAELDLGLRRLVLARRSEIGHEEPELAAQFLLDQLGSMLRNRIGEIGLHAQLGVRSDEVFVREGLRSACAYLGTAPPTNQRPRG